MCLCNNNVMGLKGKIRLYFFLELLVWLLIIVIGVSIFRCRTIKTQSKYKSYQIFLQDVDGLIVGSPVRMMGVEIGYISTVKVVQDYVYVKFLITEENYTLPKGIIATVEFNGMGGSKSLELYPPDEISQASGNLIAIKQTNRLSNALGLLNDMFDKIGSIMGRCAVFNEGISGLTPEKDSIMTPDPVEELSNSVNQVGTVIETLDNQRLDVKNRVKGLLNESGENKSN